MPAHICTLYVSLIDLPQLNLCTCILAGPSCPGIDLLTNDPTERDGNAYDVINCLHCSGHMYTYRMISGVTDGNTYDVINCLHCSGHMYTYRMISGVTDGNAYDVIYCLYCSGHMYIHRM